PDTGRNQTSKEWYGPVEFLKDQPRPESMLEKYRTPNKENFLNPAPRNITAVDQDKNKSFTSDSYYIQPTNRLTTQINTYINPANPEYKKSHAFDMISNIPDPTKRNMNEQLNWLNAANPEWQKGHA